jgi:DNA-binding transcriptional regulator YhcF (GntR family)
MGYKEIAQIIKERIALGVWSGADRVPSERVLATEFDVQRLTIRRALDALESEGVLIRRGNRGTFVGKDQRSLPNLGLLLGERNSEVGIMIQEGFRERLSHSLERSMICFDAVRPDRSGQLNLPDFHQLELHEIGGYALMPEWVRDDVVLRRHRRRMPVVLMDRRIFGFESDFVGFDNRAGGRLAAEHLLSLGHRRIAFVGVAIHETVMDRSSGVKEALGDAGILPSWPWMLTRYGLELYPPDLLRAMIDSSDRPTAVICSNDINAIKFQAALQRIGLRIPDDIAVVGFGDERREVCEALGLTTVRLPLRELGHEACDMLLTRQTFPGDSDLWVRSIPVSLTVRASCGASRARKPAPATIG